MRRSVTVIGAASSAGAYAPGQEQGPRALREAGLVHELGAAGLVVSDAGDIATRRWQPDRRSPFARNVDAVAMVAGEVAALVAKAILRGDRALVLGGDCTVGVGSVAGATQTSRRVGLLYFDLHSDMNTPESVGEGALDWMGVAHLLDLPGVTEPLARFGPRRPLLDAKDIVFVGLRRDSMTKWEQDQFDRNGMRAVDVDTVREAPAGAAREALGLFSDDYDALALHFDVDVIDFGDMPLAENTTANLGLSFAAAASTLSDLMVDDRISVMTVTEFNPFHGAADGADTAALMRALATALAGTPVAEAAGGK